MGREAAQGSGPATIFALSSGHGRAGVAVLRISGGSAASVLDRMAAPRPKPRYAGLRKIRHPETGEMLDEALVLWLPGPGSETGEDMAELQVHGGAAVIRAALQALALIPGCRPAEPGEFARRAFENGRIDLTAAEGLADLIDAETEAQRRQALRQAGGVLARLYDRWRERVLAARALAEAAIDFSDEADVAADAMGRARGEARVLLQEIEAHLDDGNRGEIVREGFRVVLAGPPNVGKSSLLNALARREVAIVSAEAGTTRDVLEVRLDLGGYAVILADTAGIREAQGPIEREGVRRALERGRAADLVAWVVDATAPCWLPPPELAGGSILIVQNKIDTAGPAVGKDMGPDVLGGIVSVSAVTGQGLEVLIERIRVEVEDRAGVVDGALLTQARHRRALEGGREALQRFVDGAPEQAELGAEDLRVAADALGRVVGRVGVEEVLGAIFGRFCVGK